jgi:hypothetical protein
MRLDFKCGDRHFLNYWFTSFETAVRRHAYRLLHWLACFARSALALSRLGPAGSLRTTWICAESYQTWLTFQCVWVQNDLCQRLKIAHFLHRVGRAARWGHPPVLVWRSMRNDAVAATARTPIMYTVRTGVFAGCRGQVASI